MARRPYRSAKRGYRAPVVIFGQTHFLGTRRPPRRKAELAAPRLAGREAAFCLRAAGEAVEIGRRTHCVERRFRDRLQSGAGAAKLTEILP